MDSCVRSLTGSDLRPGSNAGHRVKSYLTGDLERRYEPLGIEEDVFVNYGFLTRSSRALMRPRPDVRVPAARECVIGWGTSVKNGELQLEFG